MTPIQTARTHPSAVAGLLVAAALGWWWTAERMAGMGAGPGADLGTLGWFTGSWVVMMAGMMLPSLAPNLTAYVTPNRRHRASGWLLFAGGYLLVWTAAGIIAYGVFRLGRVALAGDLAWHGGGRWLAGGVIAAAAAYQFMPLKRACLTRCRGQLEQLDRVRGENRPAALAMGARSGGWCIGCSWALMAALFALGAMSLTWMALIAVLIALEKTCPWPLAARITTATVLAALALGILLAPHQVPGLAVPGSAPTHAMTAIG